MELDVKEQAEKLQGEIVNLQNQIQQVDAQINKFTQVKSDLLKEGLKKQGFLEGLQGLDNKEKGSEQK